jgi:outer membrane protein assembly factor BamB
LHLPLSFANFDWLFRPVKTLAHSSHPSRLEALAGPGVMIPILLLLLWRVPNLVASDWPTYQHDYQRSGITSETIEFPLAPAWVYRSPEPPNPAWPEPAKRDYYLSPGAQKPLKSRVAFDRAYQVAVAGGLLFFGSSADHALYCLDASTGRTNWSFFTDGPVRMAPTVADGKLYAGSDDGSVYCLQSTNGALVWKTTPAGSDNYLVANDGRFVSPFGIRSSVAVDQGVAYFTAGFFPNEGVYLCALDAATGQITAPGQWQRKLVNQAAFQGYILLSASRVYMPGSRSNPFYFDRATGATLGQFRGAMGTFALLAGNSFVFGPAARGGGQMTETGPTGDTLATYSDGNSMVVTSTRSFLLTDDTLMALDRATKNQLWRQSVAYPYALVLAGSTLVAGGDNEVAAFDSANGTKLWSAPVSGQAYGLAVADGKLFVSTDQGFIHCFTQDQSKKQSVWILF